MIDSTTDVIEVEFKEIMDDGIEYSLAYDLNKFASDIIRGFNNQYRTKFKCNMMMEDGYVTHSSLSRDFTINIYIGMKNIPDEHDKDRIKAMQIMVAHEISRYLYANMTTSSLDRLIMSKDLTANASRKIIIACAQEVAADLHAQNFYTEHEGTITRAVYENYLSIMTAGIPENEERISYYIRNGKLPPSYRLKYMRNYKVFKYNNYQIVSSIITDIISLSKRYMNKRMGIRQYEKWIIAQLSLDNFPDRPNRPRKHS